MKNFKFLTYLIAAVLMVTTVSCSDDGDDNPSPDKEALLIAGAWTGNAVYFQGQDVTETFETLFDITTMSLKFEANGTYTATLPGEPSESGNWEFANNQSQIILSNGGSESNTLDIKRLTESDLWIEGELLGEEEGKIELRFKR